MDEYYAPDIPQLFPVRTKNGYEYVELRDPKWDELETVLKHVSATLPFTFLPPQLQLEKLILFTAAHLEIPATFGTVFDLSWDLSALAAVQHDVIITTTEVSHFLLDALTPEIRSKLKVVIFVGERAPSVVEDAFAVHTLPHPFNAYMERL